MSVEWQQFIIFFGERGQKIKELQQQLTQTQQTLAKIEQDLADLKYNAKDLHWMARRYADMRSSYAPGLFNRITRYLLSVGVELNKCDGTLFARDGMGRAYDGLTEDEVGPIDNEAKLYQDKVREAVADHDAEIERLREALSFYSNQDNWIDTYDERGNHLYHPRANDDGKTAREALAKPSAGEVVE